MSKAVVLEYLQKREGQAVFANDIAADTGLSHRQVQQAVANAKHDNTGGAADAIETIIRGQQWRWKSNRSRGKRMFEELAVTKGGDILVECEDGAVYRLVEL